ncbi:Bcr/CflA family efflux MFS transporter [uncultured Selenomonas sp.]|uniref:Bcr/CflA family efflux MFS transporter n=1 Tax=uncultured Selenomonas sp. TaxID=159275 RepID=UPI0025DC4BBE|nr:Bcr/CflA family efflux MFS transporter [uncultured Selenomonas sp.]
MVQQKHLGTNAMVAFITFMNMFIPLSIDLYLPAMPQMGAQFGAGSALVGMTLTAFFFFFAVSIVLFGPVSDKYGRRPVLIASAALYVAASLICATADSIYVLIAGRILQAVGAGAIITVATALIKECFEGALMTKILAVTQALGVIAPMAAPIIGGVLLTFTSWHGAFYLLTVLGLLNLALAFLLTETLPRGERYTGGLLRSMTLLAGFLKYRRFMCILVMLSLLAAPYMAYLAVSSFVYVDEFQLTPQAYSYYFAVNSAAAVLGPGLYLRLKPRMTNNAILRFSFTGVFVSALSVFFLGHIAAIFMLLSFLPFTIIESMIRPFGMDLLLREVKENVGTASSVINFVQTLLGSIGMMLGTLPWGDFVQGLAIIMFVVLGLAVAFWRILPPKAI